MDANNTETSFANQTGEVDNDAETDQQMELRPTGAQNAASQQGIHNFCNWPKYIASKEG